MLHFLYFLYFGNLKVESEKKTFFMHLYIFTRFMINTLCVCVCVCATLADLLISWQDILFNFSSFFSSVCYPLLKLHLRCSRLSFSLFIASWSFDWDKRVVGLEFSFQSYFTQFSTWSNPVVIINILLFFVMFFFFFFHFCLQWSSSGSSPIKRKRFSRAVS